jgi:hypothetical protein
MIMAHGFQSQRYLTATTVSKYGIDNILPSLREIDDTSTAVFYANIPRGSGDPVAPQNLRFATEMQLTAAWMPKLVSANSTFPVLYLGKPKQIEPSASWCNFFGQRIFDRITSQTTILHIRRVILESYPGAIVNTIKYGSENDRTDNKTTNAMMQYRIESDEGRKQFYGVFKVL